jgi:restriction endonuclease Mrr
VFELLGPTVHAVVQDTVDAVVQDAVDAVVQDTVDAVVQDTVDAVVQDTVDAVVQEIYEGLDVLEPETILRMSEQLLQAINFIHEVGYAHGGMVGCSHCARPSRSRSITDLYRFK